MEYESEVSAFSLIEIIIVVSILAMLSGFTYVRFVPLLNTRGYQQDVQQFEDALHLARAEMTSSRSTHCGTDARIYQTYIHKTDARTYAVMYQCQNHFLTVTPPDLTTPAVLFTRELSTQSTFSSATVEDLAYFRSSVEADISSPAVGTFAIIGPSKNCTCVRVLDTGLIEDSSSCVYNPANSPTYTCTY